MTILEVQNLKKTYTTRFGGNQVEALKNVTFSVEEGEYVAIMGESGSGKTTLLNILAALDKPTGGRIKLKGRDLSTVPEREIATFRRQNLGFVFQDFNLLDTLSIRDNIFLPLVLAGRKYPEMEKRLEPIAKSLGIYELLSKFPYEVSVSYTHLSFKPTAGRFRKNSRFSTIIFAAVNRNYSGRTNWMQMLHFRPVLL